MTLIQITIKSRPIIKNDNLMRMSNFEEDDNEVNDENQNCNINKKAKRSKERKISFIIEKLCLWRKLYNGFKILFI